VLRAGAIKDRDVVRAEAGRPSQRKRLHVNMVRGSRGNRARARPPIRVENVVSENNAEVGIAGPSIGGLVNTGSGAQTGASRAPCARSATVGTPEVAAGRIGKGISFGLGRAILLDKLFARAGLVGLVLGLQAGGGLARAISWRRNSALRSVIRRHWLGRLFRRVRLLRSHHQKGSTRHCQQNHSPQTPASLWSPH